MLSRCISAQKVKMTPLPICGDAKERVAELLGRPDRVQGFGMIIFYEMPWDTEWVYLNKAAKRSVNDREAHWIYLVRFKGQITVGVSEAVRSLEGWDAILKCGVR